MALNKSSPTLSPNSGFDFESVLGHESALWRTRIIVPLETSHVGCWPSALVSVGDRWWGGDGIPRPG